MLGLADYCYTCVVLKVPVFHEHMYRESNSSMIIQTVCQITQTVC